MAFPTSGLFTQTFIDILDTSQMAVDLDLETHKVALYTNSLSAADLTSPTETGYAAAPWTSNQVPNGTGYTTGGELLTGTTWTISSGVGKWDATDTPWVTSTFSAVRGCLIYADYLTAAPTTDPGIIAITFGADYAVTSGTFTIQWNASGIFTLDLVP